MNAEVLAVAAQWVVRALLTNSLYAAVVFAAVAAFLTAAPATGPRLRRALWLLVLARLVLPPGLSHPFSLGAVLPRWSPGPDAALERVHHGDLGTSAELPSAVVADAVATRGVSWELWLGGLWLAGVALAVGRWRRDLRPYRRLARGAAPVVEPGVAGLGERWRLRFGVRRRVRLLMTAQPTTPFTLGLLRPVIVLPRAALGRPAMVEPAIAHEMAHVARADALWLTLERLVRCLYFFHPLALLACSALDHERERSCDQHVLEAGGMTARDYAAGLVEALGLGRVGAGASTFIPRRRRITVRVHSILEPRRGRALPTPVVVVLVALIGVVGLPMAGSTGADATAAEPPAVNPPAAVESSTVVDRLAHPLPEGRLTMPWGPGRNPFTKSEFHHDGVDLAAPLGTPIRAAADGVVLDAVVDFGDSARGRVVRLAHDGDLVTSYGHLEDVKVEPGQRVARGEIIATVGSTGLSTGPHLHLEVRRHGELVDPVTVVDGL